MCDTAYPIHVNELITKASHLLEVSISGNVSLGYDIAEDIPAFAGTASQITQVLINLIINATEAIEEEDGVITATTGMMICNREYLDIDNAAPPVGLIPLPEGRYIFVKVTDTGCGIEADSVERIFEPFFTTKFGGRGMGMPAVDSVQRAWAVERNDSDDKKNRPGREPLSTTKNRFGWFAGKCSGIWVLPFFWLPAA